MLPKTFSILALAMMISSLSLANLSHKPASEAANAVRPALKFNFENCVAFGGGSSADYSEFIAQSTTNSQCTQLSVFGDHLYRLNPNRNSHSCAPGMNGTTAMCISAHNHCSYFAGDERSIRVNVLVQPGPDGVGNLDNISFFSKAPRQFQFISGNSGVNNYPTKFGIRILTDAGEIYRKDNITTSADWAYRTFDLSDIPATTVTSTTLFRIEILPYCLIGNGSQIQAWDIEDLVITGGCNNVNGGNISTNSNTDFCSANGQSNVVNSILQNNRGQNFSWLVADANDQIVTVQNTGNIGFNALPNGNLRIFHIAYDGQISGLFSGSFLYNIGGCYDLSNPITVSNKNVSGGDLTGPLQSRTFTICPNSGVTSIATSLVGNRGDETRYVLTSSNGQILAIYNNPNLDFGNLGVGNYSLQAVSYSGPLAGLVSGANINNLNGCYALSSAITLTRNSQVVGGGMVTSTGQTSFNYCNNVQSLNVTLTGNAGSNRAYVITNPQNRIISIQQNDQIFIGGINETNFSIWNISYEDGLTGLVIDGFVSNLAGCFDLSNPITVVRDQVNAGDISVNGFDVTSLCLKNNDNQAVQVDVVNQFGDNITYLVTDEGGNILEVVQLSNQSTIDFDNAGPGVCNIYALAYNGTISGVSPNTNIANITGDCFDLSEGIRVERNEVESGSIDGPSTIDICVNDPTESSINFTVSGAGGQFRTWIVTDDNGNILETTDNSEIDFSNAPSGVCRVYHLSHSTDPVLVGPGNTINDIVLSCFELSDPVTVNRKQTQGGSFTLANGTTSIMLLIGQGATASFSTVVNNNIGDEIIFITYDDEGTILGTQSSSDFDFSSASEGTCSIVAVSYCGTLAGATIGNRIDMLEGCYSQSNNIDVTKMTSTTQDSLVAAIILTNAGMTMADVCIGDSTPDSLTVVFDQNPVGADGTFIVTDDQGEILELSDSNIFGFANAGSGVCNIYHIVYNQAPSGLAMGTNISMLDGDFELSTPIVVTRNVVAGGSLMTSDSLTSLNVTVGDGQSDLINVITDGAVGDSSIIVITNSQGVITEIPSLPIEFENQDPGTCLIWNLTYTGGLQGLEVGAAVPSLAGCFALSNPVSVTKMQFVGPGPVNGGMLMSTDSLTTVEVCLDGTSTNFFADVILTGAVGDTMTFVLTDTSGVITDLGFGLPYDFGNSAAGTCLMWNLSWNDSLPDLAIGIDVDTLSGNFDLSNPVTYNKEEVVGGALMTTDSLTEISIIVGDGMIDSIDVILNTIVGDSSAWVVTDASGTILELPVSPPFIFEGAGAGVCFIWNLSYSTGLTGLEVDNNVNQLDGCFSLSNSIQVTRTEPMATLDGGMIMTIDSLIETSLCLGTGDDELDVILNGAVGENMNFIAADTSGFIWGVFDNSSFQFNGASPGICEIWHISYNGSIVGLVAGQDLDTLSGDFDLSNAITLVRNEVDGGAIMTVDSMTSVTVTLGGATVDSVDVVLTGEIGDNQAWVITDTLGNILDLPTGPPFSFEGLGVGACQIWSLSFANGLTGAAVGNNVSVLNGCFQLSNPIAVTKTQAMMNAVGGSILTTDSLTTADLCLATNQDTVDVLLSGASGENMTYAITDTAGVIISLFSSPPFQFGGLSAGTCEITHVSYNGSVVGLDVGEDIDTLMGDFDLSNIITVNRADAEGGSLMTTDSLTALTITVGDGVIDSIDVILESNAADTSVWVITDDQGNILELPTSPPFVFEDAGAGVCQIWNLSYNFGLTGLVVDNNVSQLDGCFDLSNPITVTRMTPPSSVSGGTIMTSDSMSSAAICLNSLNLHVDVLLDGEMGDSSIYVVTDTSGIILSTSSIDSISFANASVGVCEIWNLSFDGSITGLAIGEDVDTLMGDFDLSNNITVTKQAAEGGLAQYIDSTFQKTITVGDGMPDTLNVMVGGVMGDTMTWVVTDVSGNILDITTNTEFVFDDNTAPGECRIYHLSAAAGLTGLTIGNNINIDLIGCFDFSNFLFLEKLAFVSNVLVAGNLMTIDSMSTVDLCVGDNGAELDLLLSGQNGANMSFVVTDTTGVILALPMTEPIQFPASMSQTCEVLHIVYDSILTGFVVGEDIDTLSGNFLLSNVVTANKTQLLANSITLTNGTTTASVTTADGDPDTLTVVSTAILADTSLFIVVDNGVIVTVQDSSTFIFENQPSGLCEIYEVSYNTGFTGLTGGATLSDLSGCFAVSNLIVVNKTSAAGINGGVITTPEGNNVEVCLTNTIVDSIMVSLSNVAGDTTAWVVTDTFGIVLALPQAPPFAFDTLSAGACQIWNLSYNIPITGLSVGVSVDSIMGTHEFSNPVNVDKNESIAGSLLTAGGMDFDTIMLGQMPPDSLFVNMTGTVAGENMTWMITDTLGNILDLNSTPPFTFETSGAGQCNVWNIAYANGISGLQLGSNIFTELDGCYDLSDSIRVVKVSSTSNLVDGGTIQIVGGATTYEVCQGNAIQDSIDVAISGQLGPNFSFVITNAAGFLLSSIDTTQMVRDTVRVPVDGLPADSIFLYHMAYQNGVSTSLGTNLSGNPLLDLSNPIILYNNDVDAGSLIGPDTLTITVGDGMIDTITVGTFGTVQGDMVNWVVHDSSGIITSIDAGPPFFFENSGGGIFTIQRLASISGLMGLAVGNNIADLEGCFDFSNPRVVVANQATLSGGTLSSIDSLTTVEYCFNSSFTVDTLEVILADTLGENFAWVVTDTSGLILDLPADSLFVFDSMSPETSLVWNLSYEGSIVGLAVGEDVDTLMGSFLFSNPISVGVNNVNGGTISTPSGQTDFTFCVGDGVLDVVNFTLADTLGGNYQYVITDTMNSILLVPTAGNDFQDFEGFGDGVCRVYNLSSTEEIIGLVPGVHLDSLAGCYEVSNFLTITKNGVDGSILGSMPIAVDNSISFCVSDGVLDSLVLSTQSTMGSYQYVITDENDEIDSVLVGNIIDFEGSEFGTCKIYGVSYTGNFIGMPGDTINIQAMSSECEDISTLPITVEKADCSNIIMTEVIGTTQVELQNTGTAPANAALLFMCGANADYTQLRSLPIICGDTILQPGDHVILDLDGVIAVDPADGELGLYTSPQWGSFAAMKHYVEWGSSGHNRTNIAVGAGLWMTGQFAVPFTATTALKYDGMGILNTDWSEGNSTPCASNFGGGGTSSRLVYNTYPNPAQGNFNLFIPKLPSEKGTLVIYDSFGKIVETREVKAGIQYEIDLGNYGSGLYYTKVLAGREGVVKKMMIVK